jgi:hypothetical protein
MAERWRIDDDIPPIEESGYVVTFKRVRDGNLSLPEGWTHFGFFEHGPMEIRSVKHGDARLPRGGFFRVPGAMSLYGRAGFVISQKGERGFFQSGGSFLDLKAIKYPPGGEQNCLIWPAGPYLSSLNYLKLTSGMGWQEEHSHPSPRLNIVLTGRAMCKASNGLFEIAGGDIILLKTNEDHSFGDAHPIHPLTFVAFHPDSAMEIFTHAPMPAQTIIKRD